jgi:hypothetical protein
MRKFDRKWKSERFERHFPQDRTKRGSKRIHKMRSYRENGQSLMDPLETLSKYSFTGHSYTRLLKHCVQGRLVDKDLFGKKSFSKLKSAELATFHEAVIAATKTESSSL